MRSHGVFDTFFQNRLIRLHLISLSGKTKGISMKVLLSIDGIAISVIDETPQELMYLSVDKIDLTYTNLAHADQVFYRSPQTFCFSMH